MPSVLADQQIEIIYARDPISIEALDEDRIFDELTRVFGCAGATRWLGRHPLTAYDHVMLATDRRDNQAVALLAAKDGKTTQEEFLLLETAFVRVDMRGRRVMSRMMAALLLRIAGLGPVPTVIAACTSDSAWLGLLQDFGQRLTGAACFPQPAGRPIQLRSAALAQRIARALHPRLRFEPSTGALRGALAVQGADQMSYINGVRASRPDEHYIDCLSPPDQLLTLIDLRTEQEAGIIEDARRLYRGRRAAASRIAA